MIIIVNASATQKLPVGAIVPFSLLEAVIPTGWQKCDGTNGTPDMSSCLVMGASISSDLLVTGGATTHTHTGGAPASGNSHSHGFSFTTSGPSATVSSANAELGPTARPTSGHSHGTSGVSTGSTSHAHSSGGTTGSGTSLPPTTRYYFIMRLS